MTSVLDQPRTHSGRFSVKTGTQPELTLPMLSGGDPPLPHTDTGEGPGVQVSVDLRGGNYKHPKFGTFHRDGCGDAVDLEPLGVARTYRDVRDLARTLGPNFNLPTATIKRKCADCLKAALGD
jgi:hypothetical protein